MKRFRPSLRRLASFAAAGFVGAAATLFIATPAFAHHPTSNGVAHCDLVDGGWWVDWTVGSSTHRQEFQLTAVQAKDGASNNIAGTFIGELGSLPTAFKLITETFAGSQHYSNSVASVWLQVTGIWKDTGLPATYGPHTNSMTASGVVVIQRPICAAVPVVTFKDNCDGTVTVTLDNEQGSQPATFSITGAPDTIVPGGQKVDVTVPGGNGLITVQTAGQDDWTHTWRTPTTPCPTTPVTGASVTGTVGIGAGLVVAGVALIALLLLFRRRRTVAGQ